MRRLDVRARFHLLTFLRNVKWAFARNGFEERLALEQRLEKLERRVELTRPDSSEYRDLLLFEEILNCAEPRFKDEIEYCRRHGRLDVFPYEKIRNFPKVEVYFDAEKQLPYVLHDGKRLYYPAQWGKGSITFSYTNAVAVEGILGDGCLEKAPHNYLDARFPVKEGAVVCDFGAAEGLLGLHFAEQSSRLLIGECDEKWQAPLRATFEPWKQKTIIVSGALGMGSQASGEGEMQLLLENEAANISNAPFFIKFDIEGAERFAIQEAAFFFQHHPDVTVACAAYHRQDDGMFLEKLFRRWGYETAFSDGAMLFLLDHLVFPYFRPGILHAKKG